ncbi:DUF2304 domain-containing protein [Clostridium omnivorum]|uniref:Membrane protein n=1 Tax=Clostridium omnivorum TaxID=1604902 RepID=A0ABQ5N374_9CLOT|nr:DUF2304 domain-containing protein [Clostridium sp. E14]GLC29644.1 membrane protein [Clostridium sp. E14]
MNSNLQIILLIASILFFVFIVKMVLNYKLDLKYSITWIFSSIIFILITIFPNLLSYLSKLLFIREPVNALFLIVIFFLLVIAFSLTLALSKKSNNIKSLVQELGILKLQVEDLSNQLEQLHGGD